MIESDLAAVGLGLLDKLGKIGRDKVSEEMVAVAGTTLLAQEKQSSSSSATTDTVAKPLTEKQRKKKEKELEKEKERARNKEVEDALLATV